MKKKVWIFIITTTMLLALLALLFVPIPGQTLDDGTREYVALTYKIVNWHKETSNYTHEETVVYFGKDRSKSLDELWEMKAADIFGTVRATVIEINGSSVLLEPLEGEWERKTTDRIRIDTGNINKLDIEVGSVVEVSYRGTIMESYPAQISVVSWSFSKTLRHLEYSEQWLDKATAEQRGNDLFSDVVITEIYANCFFARVADGKLSGTADIKFNGALSEEWCVGDYITCTYENVYYDTEANRIECDLLSLRESDWNKYTAAKPVIYLYPETETEVSVKLTLDGELTCTYPSYENGWTVTASPDGTLTDADGQTYNYLYWEGEGDKDYDLSRGFCIKGQDTAQFLEWALAELGLTRREANEFIVYWLPLMQNNPYNIIAFQGEAYTDSARLEISPAPDTLIRVFMTWKASDTPAVIEEQPLQAPSRVGFTVVEWGGAEMK